MNKLKIGEIYKVGNDIVKINCISQKGEIEYEFYWNGIQSGIGGYTENSQQFIELPPVLRAFYE